MTYWRHLRGNMRVAARCLVMAAFHAAHGILPIRCLEHERWGLKHVRVRQVMED